MSMASWTSPRVSGRTLPISRVISLEKSSLRCNSSSAARNMISARFGAGTSRHFLYASLAASTAWSASSSVPETNMPTSSSAFAGLRFSYALPLRDSTHSPLMKFLNIRGATDVAILPPQSPKLAALLFVWSPADLNARHYRAESKFYRCISIRSNTVPVLDGSHVWLPPSPVKAIMNDRNDRLSISPKEACAQRAASKIWRCAHRLRERLVRPPDDRAKAYQYTFARMRHNT